ncbi:MAG: phosphatase PAP2 family protein, partial [Bacteroidetes bacterium]|nr:phosphatase PAP2 family protein [Bacteroidota bacterium]
RALQKSSINPIDRLTAGWYSEGQSTLSDVLVGGSILSPLLFVLDERMRGDLGIIGMMYLETISFATFMPSYGKGSVRRVRPFVYGSPAPMTLKEDFESLRSFYSGHATWAFATSIFFATVYTDYHPDSEHTELIWGGAIGLASAVSLLRVTSGAHFLSDIAVGAAVGTAIGYTIPALHRRTDNSWSLAPAVTPQGSALRFTLHLK